MISIYRISTEIENKRKSGREERKGQRKGYREKYSHSPMRNRVRSANAHLISTLCKCIKRTTRRSYRNCINFSQCGCDKLVETPDGSERTIIRTQTSSQSSSATGRKQLSHGMEATMCVRHGDKVRRARCIARKREKERARAVREMRQS